MVRAACLTMFLQSVLSLYIYIYIPRRLAWLWMLRFFMANVLVGDNGGRIVINAFT